MSDNQKQQDRSNPRLRQVSRVLTLRGKDYPRMNAAYCRFAKKKMSRRRRRHSKQITRGEE